MRQNNTFTGPDLVRFGAAGAFAYQAIGGLAVPIREAPRLSLTVEYRFFGLGQAGIPVTRVSTSGDLVNGATSSSSTHNGFITQDNSVLVGLRYQLGR